MKLKRILLMTVGLICVVLGVLGIFLPLLPTTPFILLASVCFANSSERFHTWLINHPRLGPIIHTWQSGQGIPRKVRNRVIITIVITMSISALIVGQWWAYVFLFVTGACVCTYLMRMPLSDE